MPDDRHRSGARALVIARERASKEWLLSEDGECVGGDAGAEGLLRQRAVVADVHRRGGQRGEVRERPALGAPVLELGMRQRGAPLRRADPPRQHVDLAGVTQRPFAQEDAVHEREASGIHTDAERKDDDGGRRERSFLRE
jgi:hypothetical protein